MWILRSRKFFYRSLFFPPPSILAYCVSVGGFTAAGNMAISHEDVVDDSIDDMQWVVYSAGKILTELADENNQLDDLAVAAPKILPRLQLLTQHLISPQAQRAWKGLYRTYGNDDQIYGGLFFAARGLTRWRGLAKAPGGTIGSPEAATVERAFLFKALTSFIFFCWSGCPSEDIKLTCLKDAVSQGVSSGGRGIASMSTYMHPRDD